MSISGGGRVWQNSPGTSRPQPPVSKPVIALRNAARTLICVNTPFVRRRYFAATCKDSVMRNSLAAAIMLLMSSIAASAGPCLSDIASMQARLDARLSARAATGPTATESVNALRHRQPTPQSLAAAERELGELPAENGKAIADAMTRARDADRAGDREACERALDDVRQAISP